MKIQLCHFDHREKSFHRKSKRFLILGAGSPKGIPSEDMTSDMKFNKA